MWSHSKWLGGEQPPPVFTYIYAGYGIKDGTAVKQVNMHRMHTFWNTLLPFDFMRKTESIEVWNRISSQIEIPMTQVRDVHIPYQNILSGGLFEYGTEIVSVRSRLRL